MRLSYSTSQVGSLVNERPERARVLERCGIGFYECGQQTLAAACRAVGANVAYVCQELAALDAQPDMPGEPRWAEYSLNRLIEDIVDTHHAYLRQELPRLEALFRTMVTTRGASHPEIRCVHNVFRAFADEQLQHLFKEERLLFPMINALEVAQQQRRALPVFHCGSISNPIGVMLREHREAGDALHAMRRLTHEFTPPPNACAAYRTLLERLVQLEIDLHLHMHKENNVLFPRALELEAELVGY